VRTSFSNKTEPRHTSILTSVLTSMLIFPVVDCVRFSQWLFSSYLASTVTWPNPLRFFSYGITSRIVCTCALCHVIYRSCDKRSWRQSLLLTTRCCNVCDRNLITGLTSAASPRVDISSTCKVGQTWSVSPSVDMLSFSMSILATVPQRSEITEGLTNYTVYTCAHMRTRLLFHHVLNVVTLEGYMA